MQAVTRVTVTWSLLSVSLDSAITFFGSTDGRHRVGAWRCSAFQVAVTVLRGARVAMLAVGDQRPTCLRPSSSWVTTFVQTWWCRCS